MTITHFTWRNAPRLLLFALLAVSVNSIIPGGVTAGDGGGSPPFPPPLPVPSDTILVPPDSTANTLEVEVPK